MSRLILASASPRRLEILRSLGLDPEVHPSNVPEISRPGEPPEAMVQRLARDKVAAALPVLSGVPRVPAEPAREAPGEPSGEVGIFSSEEDRLVARARDLPRMLVLGADTAVVVDGEILGKPRDPVEASRMLARLSGRSHEVLTGLALGTGDGRRLEQGVESTQVRFAPLSPGQIDEYVATGEPMDKAGAYGIQSGAWSFAEGLEGSYTNVVGLPVELFEVLLARFGFSIDDLRASKER